MKEKDSLNKMGSMPVNKLMISMGIPIIISMMMQALYNIVDSAFVSNMKFGGEQALNALTLAFPVQMLMVAVGIGTGVGVNALLSKTLGMGDRDRASRIGGNAFFLGIIIYIACALFGIFGVRPYIASQTNNSEILEMGVSYLRICCIASPGVIFYALTEKMLQATGRSTLSTISQLSGAITNIVLDPILIYGWLGLPEMGVKGAAYATVIGQVVSAVLGIIFHYKANKEFDKGIKNWKPDGSVIKGIYSIGVAAILAQALMSVMTYCLNIILVKADESMVTCYGLYYKIQQFILFAAFGLRDAITPIVSYNHGMGSKKRVREGIKYGTIYTLVIMLIGTIVMEVFANPFAGIFKLSGDTENICIAAMRIISIGFVFAGVNVAFQGVFQALDGGVETLLISLFRTVVFVLPLVWLFVKMVKGNPDKYSMIWWAFPIAEIVTMIFAIIFMIRVSKKKIDVME